MKCCNKTALNSSELSVIEGLIHIFLWRGLTYVCLISQTYPISLAICIVISRGFRTPKSATVESCWVYLFGVRVCGEE